MQGIKLFTQAASQIFGILDLLYFVCTGWRGERMSAGAGGEETANLS
jgi:hypothetical protein